MISALNIPEIILIVSVSLAAAVFVILVLYLLVSYITFVKIIKKPKKQMAMNPKNPFISLMGEDVYEYLSYNEEKGIEFEKIPMKDVEVKTEDGLLLKGSFYPAENSKRTIICMHGYNSNPKGDFAAITPFLNSQGFNLLYANHRGHGPSEGKYIGFGILDYKDSLKWIELASELVEESSIFLYGVSMGAATVMMASELDLPSNVIGIIEDCGFTSVWDIFSYQIRHVFSLRPFPIIHLAQFYSKIFAKYTFKKPSPVNSVTHSSVPILFIHGTKDSFVPTFMGEATYEACSSPKKKLMVEGAGHAQSYFKNPELYEEEVMDFIDRCLSSTPLSTLDL